MHPILFKVGTLRVTSYAFFMIAAFVVGYAVRRAEVRRLGYAKEPGHQWVGLGALVGAVVGTKIGMVLFEPPTLARTVSRGLALDFSGKTVVGALVFSFISVEITKRIVGIKESTGDGFALAFPVSAAIGRVGCFLNGCCYGKESHGPTAVFMHGLPRHPTQLYEAVLVAALAVAVAVTRRAPRERGRLWRLCLVGYATIRFVLEWLRDDPVRHVGPLTAVQLVCLGSIVFLLYGLRRAPQASTA